MVVGRRRGFLTGDPEVGARAEALGDRVRFTGFVEEEELRRRVAGATALVLAARAGALPEVCGEAALYCDPLDAPDIAAGLRRLATEPDLAGRLGAAGRERAREFSWDQTADAVAAAIRRLVGDARRDGPSGNGRASSGVS